MRQLLLFLYSTRNLLGAALAFIGILLYFAGLGAALGPAWILVVLGLYIAGYLAAPFVFRRNADEENELENEANLEEMQAELEKVLVQAKRKLPPELSEKVESITDSIRTILPTLAGYNEGDYNLFTIRQTALEYLPEAIKNYLALPPGYATSTPVQNGKTARQLLGEQLDLLDEEMKEVVKDIANDDTQKLLIHGRFLADKFQKDGVLIKR